MFRLCVSPPQTFCYFFFFNDTATTEIYTLSLHDALPIYTIWHGSRFSTSLAATIMSADMLNCTCHPIRSEEHTSELQSQSNLVCRLLLEKKKKTLWLIDDPDVTSRLLD